MNSIIVTEARKTLGKLINEMAYSHEPVIISWKNANAVLISEADWNAVNEILQLFSTQGMNESLIEVADSIRGL